MSINGRLSSQALELFDQIRLLNGRILTGQHNYPNTGSSFSDEAAQLVGKYPALWGQDFGFSGGDDKDSILARQAIVDEAKRQHELGSVITLMWHAVRPTHDEPVTFMDSIMGKVTDAEFKDVLTPGTTLYSRWQAQVDTIAPYLVQLRDANIPILWRPYHEMNGDWFWWCNKRGEYGYAKLWRQLYDRLNNHWQLNNLIWVWNPAAFTQPNIGHYSEFYPGHDVVDMLAADIYGNDYQQKFYDDLLELAEGRPIAIGECGEAPDATVLEAQPRWAWFMIWTEFVSTHNTSESLTELFNHPKALTRSAFPRPK